MFWKRVALLALVTGSLPIGASMALASNGASLPKMWLACQNGHEYPIRPTTVSRESDLVTGYLITTPSGRGIHLRLVPMGVGYRYAGAGVWFDGLRGEAVLNWGSRHETPCTVMQE